MPKFSLKDKAIDFWYNRNVKPKIDELGIEEVRQRLYNNIHPHSYIDPTRRIKSALNNQKSRLDELIEKAGTIGNLEDEIYAEYLNIPENKRHNYTNTVKLHNSLYTPSKGNTSNYKALDLPEDYLNSLVKTATSFTEDLSDYTIRKGFKARNNKRHPTLEIRNPLKFGENRVSKALVNIIGKHTIGRNVDPNNGEYVSYYDLWDLAPISGNGKDESRGIGKPIEFYDRIYLDDYYDIDKDKRKSKKGDYYGGYLPEVDIYKQGGRISLETI